MGKKEPVLPPGPNPRPDQMSEEVQKKLRDFQRTHPEEGKGRAGKKKSGGDSGETPKNK
jgi:hypothetical protein